MDQEEILPALHKPPVISADFFPEYEGLVASPPELPATPGNMLLEESAGMLGLRLWLEPLGEEFTKLADGWRGDRYRLHATSDADVHLLWDIRFDSEKSADEFVKAALSMVSSLTGSEKDPAPGEILPTPEDRFAGIVRIRPDVVRFINASSRDHAGLLAK
jgi:hypothetical protein